MVWGPSLAVVAVPFSVVGQRGRPFSLWREREREGGESHHNNRRVLHTPHSESGTGAQGVPYTAAAVSFRRRRREERYWLVGSLWVHRLVSCCCARGGGSMHPFCRGGRRRHTSHHAPATTLVPRKWSTTYCCAVHLSTLIVGERVCRLCCCCCCCYLKRWRKRPVQTISSSKQQPQPGNFSTFFCFWREAHIHHSTEPVTYHARS